MEFRSRMTALLVAALSLCILESVVATDRTLSLGGYCSAAQPAGTPALVVEPSPSPTATSAPSAPYFDDFEDPESGWFTGSSAAPYSWSYETGRYKVVITGDNHGQSVRRGKVGGEGVYEVDQYLDGSPTSVGALLFAVSPDWGDYYAFEVRGDGYYSFWRIDEDDWQVIVLWTQHAAIHPGSAMNHLQADWRYGQIDLYVNGVHLDTVYDDTHHRKAYFGLRGVAREGAPATTTVFWDNYSYWPLGVPTPTPTLTPTITPTPVSRCRLPLILNK